MSALPWHVWYSTACFGASFAIMIRTTLLLRRVKRHLAEWEAQRQQLNERVEDFREDLEAAKLQFAMPPPFIVRFLVRWTTSDWLATEIARVEATVARLPGDQE